MKFKGLVLAIVLVVIPAAGIRGMAREDILKAAWEGVTQATGESVIKNINSFLAKPGSAIFISRTATPEDIALMRDSAGKYWDDYIASLWNTNDNAAGIISDKLDLYDKEQVSAAPAIKEIPSARMRGPEAPRPASPVYSHTQEFAGGRRHGATTAEEEARALEAAMALSREQEIIDKEKKAREARASARTPAVTPPSSSAAAVPSMRPAPRGAGVPVEAVAPRVAAVAAAPSARVASAGTKSIQGRRSGEMEDAHYNGNPFFGVYDGHTFGPEAEGKGVGRAIADYVANNLHTNIYQQYQNPDDTLMAYAHDTLRFDIRPLLVDRDPVKKALLYGFLQTQREIPNAFRDKPEEPLLPYIGTTAVTTFFHGDNVYTAWVGDSEALVGRYDGTFKELTNDNHHAPEGSAEEQRIIALGGNVEHFHIPGLEKEGYDNIIVGTGRERKELSLARTLGDLGLNPYVSPVPAITKYHLDPKDAFIILACDGVWDLVPKKTAVQIVGETLRRNRGDAQAAAAALVDKAFSYADNRDNITATVVVLGH